MIILVLPLNVVQNTIMILKLYTIFVLTKNKNKKKLKHKVNENKKSTFSEQ